MFQNWQGRVRRVLPWLLLALMLSGCGSGLWQASGLAEGEEQQWEQWLLEGWSLGGQDGSMSALLWKFLCGTVPTNPYGQLASGMPGVSGAAGHIVNVVTEEEAFYAAALVPDQWQHRFEKVKELTVSEDVQVYLV